MTTQEIKCKFNDQLQSILTYCNQRDIDFVNLDKQSMDKVMRDWYKNTIQVNKVIEDMPIQNFKIAVQLKIKSQN